MATVNYANMAIDLIKKQSTGRLVVFHNGRYTDVAISTVLKL